MYVYHFNSQLLINCSRTPSFTDLDTIYQFENITRTYISTLSIAVDPTTIPNDAVLTFLRGCSLDRGGIYKTKKVLSRMKHFSLNITEDKLCRFI
jgi:hypothetical protein